MSVAADGAAFATLESLLLLPLWKITSDYFNRAEQWYYASVKFFQLVPFDFARMPNARPVNIDSFLELIIEGDDVHILKALHRMLEYYSAWFFRSGIIGKMISLDRPKMLEFVHVHRPEDLVKYYDRLVGARNMSAETGSLKVLNWEQRRGYNLWGAHTARELVLNGHLSILQRLQHGKIKCPVDSNILICAIQSGHVDAVKWLQTVADVKIAEINYEGYIKTVGMLKYFLEDSKLRCSTEYLLKQAIDAGFLDIVKYLVENTDAAEQLGEAHAVDLAGRSSNTDPFVLEYLLDRGFPIPENGDRMHPETSEWFYAHYG